MTQIPVQNALDVYNAACEFFAEGIWIKTEFSHPCGYDWLSFEMIDDLDHDKFDASDFSHGIYNSHEFEGKTLQEILNILGPDGWCFERSGINWC